MHVLGCCFFFNDMATTEIYTLSLHDALPIFAFAGTLALGRTFERERQSETLRALLLAPAARPAVYVGKLLGILVLLVVTELVLVPLVAFLFQAPLLAHPFWLAAVVAAGTLGFTSVGTLFA